MLSKLLKLEIKATARIFLPLYIVLLVFAVIQRIITTVGANNWQAPQIISMVVYSIILAGTFVVTFVVMIQRFYKNLLSDEGYLMFTLPTTTWRHITSKLLISMMWVILSGIVAIISIFIIADYKYPIATLFHDLSEAIGQYFGYFGASGILLMIETLLFTLIGLASSVLIIYASLALGHLFNRRRVLASLGAFIILSTVTQIIYTVLGYINQGAFAHNYPGPSFILEPGFQLIVWYAIIITALISAGYFAVTNHILSKRLNLE
jgi:hypothetical protein